MANSSLLQNKAEHKDKKDLLDVTEATLLKVADVAKYLRLTPETVRTMARQSKIPSIKMGRTYRFRSNDIDAWLDSQINNSDYSVHK